MLNASVFGKNVKCDGFSPTANPSADVTNQLVRLQDIQEHKHGKESTRKSIKMVLFNCSDDADDVSYRTPESEINEQKTDEIQTDHRISSMDLEKVENNENSRRKSKLVRQDAENRSPVLTKSLNTTQDGDQDVATLVCSH